MTPQPSTCFSPRRRPIVGSRLLMLGGALALGGGVALATPTPTTPGGQDTPRAGVVASVAATGCLERWTSHAPPSPTGAPAEPPPAGVEFVLADVEGADTPRSGDTDADRRDEPRYLLLPSPTLDYARHVNQRVTIVGTIAPQPSPGASAADRAINPSSSETNLPERPPAEPYRANLVEVTSLKVVAGTCRP